MTDPKFYANRCKHHEPQHACCSAGVRYTDLVPELYGRALRLPCFITERSYDVVTCDKLVRYTKEEAVEEIRKMDAALQAWSRGHSPCCDAALINTVLSKRSSEQHCSKCGKYVSRTCGR